MKLAHLITWLRLGWLLSIGLGIGAWLPAANPPLTADELLFEGPMPHFVITLAPEQLALLAERRWMGGGRSVAQGSVQIGTNIITGVRLQTKGSGSFRTVAFRPSITLKFKKSAPCFGLTKLHLNNSVHDPTRLCEVLGGELHRQAGVPTPRATPARVTLNGRDLGIYVLKEGFDRRFLARHFRDASGDLYDPAWGEDIDSPLEVDSGPAKTPRTEAAVQGNPNRTAQTARESLLAAAGAPMSRRLAAISARLDVDRFLTTMALQLLTDDWDGYVRHRNNYRLYHDPLADRLVFLPHGMDHLFGSPRSRLFWPEITGIVASSLMATPGTPDRIRDRVAELGRTVFAETNVLALVDRTEARLLAGLDGQSGGEVEFYRQQAALLRDRIRNRIAWVRSGTPPPLELPVGQGQVLEGWEPWAEVPDTDLQQRNRPDGKSELFIEAHSPATCASWRARLVLAPGQYRFEGEVSVRGVRLFPQARDPGVGLRVVPARRGTGLSGTLEDARVAHEFRVEASTEVVFVAELSGHAGSASYLAESLRVVRVPRLGTPR